MLKGVGIKQKVSSNKIGATIEKRNRLIGAKITGQMKTRLPSTPSPRFMIFSIYPSTPTLVAGSNYILALWSKQIAGVMNILETYIYLIYTYIHTDHNV